ncbi:MAG: molecular chaperone HtpG [Candidatus Omnitrophota bacterium]
MDRKENIRQFEYKAEMKQLLHLIIHSLYTHPEVFLRELISNASDALNKVRISQLTDKEIPGTDIPLEIRIELDTEKKTFSIQDSGIGMTEEGLVNNIGTVARSGTLEFIKSMKEEKRSPEDKLIGKFGVGFYSVFMVTDEVTIETRYADNDSKGLRWKSSGESSFTVEEIDKPDRGTKIYFKFKDSAEEFCSEYRIKDIITRYSNFADFPIFLGKEQVNTVTALWRKNAAEIKEDELKEFYKFITNDFENPMGHIHLSLEGAVVSFKALLFIPQSVPFDFFKSFEKRGIQLYSNKILIQRECKDLLPEYLRFVRGVVDTIDLPLNVSREVTQSSPLMMKMKNIITGKILSFLEDWAKNDPDKYNKFYKNFGKLFKTGVDMDLENRDRIVALLRFETSLKEKGEMVSLKEYAAEMNPGQKEIYYLAGDSRDAVENNPNMEYFKKNKIAVLILTDPVDVFILPSVGEYDKKEIKSIDKADIDLSGAGKTEQPGDNLSKSLLSLFKETLKEKVEEVSPSKRLVDSAVTLVTGKGGMDFQMEKMMKMIDKEHKGAKKILEVNVEHPLIRNLSKMYIADSSNPLLVKCITQLYESALLVEGRVPSTAEFVKRMTDIMEEATK